VASLEDWIKQQQKTVSEDTKKIETAYEANRASLLATGAFTEEEVKNQLTSVQQKAEAKKEVYNNYEDLLTRASSIYN
jgi:secreted Zn-dependent insulinase-like peptidase